MNGIKHNEPISEERWNKVCEFNRQLYDDYFIDNVELSNATRTAYRSYLRIWFVYVAENLGNKKQVDIKSRDYKRFQNYLVDRGMSYSGISTQRSAISSLNFYIETYYEDEYPMFRNFITKAIPKPEKSYVNKKVPPTREELDEMIRKLEEGNRKDKYQLICYLKFTFDTGCRRAETRQLLKDVVNSDPVVRKITAHDREGNKIERESRYYVTNEIRCKGRGKTGKVRKLKFSEDTMLAIKKWLEVRGEDDCPYVFTSGRGENARQVSVVTINKWCSTVFTDLLGRRFHPHILREARATDAAIEQGRPIEQIASLLGHNSTETTKIYICNDEDVEESDALFADF